MAPPPAGLIWLRDRFVIVGLLLLVTAATWYYTVDMARTMGSMESASGMSHEHMHHAMGLHGALSPRHEHLGAFGLAMMWVIMMIAMMLPSAIPVTVMHARMLRSKDTNPRVRSLIFALGYVVVWGGFSVAAAAVQIALERSSVLSAMWMRFERVEVGAVVLIGAGLFQFSSMKNACLRQCRTPVGFLMTEWRDGMNGALGMGLKNGLYCVGCCWALMLLLFVGGVMSMLWMLALTLLMLVEKIAPRGPYVARGAGVVMIAAGIAQLFGLLG
jgi:predicted metal-binding membrane protein